MDGKRVRFSTIRWVQWAAARGKWAQVAGPLGEAAGVLGRAARAAQQ
jgi:hypothetical protein